MDNKSYKENLNDIKAFVFDVDGVLTDGTIQVTTSGEMYRTMNVKDGYALKTAIDCGYAICIISGGSNEGVRKRLEGLGIEEINLGTHDKITHLNNFIKKHNLSNSELLYMGDDLPDLHAIAVERDWSVSRDLV